MSNIIVQRYLYQSANELWLDSDGLLVSGEGSFSHKKLISQQEALALPGGVLLAEGGMGKTTFLEQLASSLEPECATLIKLGEYVGDSPGFQACLQQRLQAIPTGEKYTLFLDGLDENPELAGVVIRTLRTLPAEVSVWIASRDVAAIRAIQQERETVGIYNLAPLTEENIAKIASASGLIREQFLDDIHRLGIRPICAKPLGCALVISVLQGPNPVSQMTLSELWSKGIERLCDETPSSTRKLLRPPIYTLDQVVECSSWIALCMSLTEPYFIWAGEQSYCPSNCMAMSALANETFTVDLVRETLGRGVFAPMGDGRFRFAHPLYAEYLAANGFARYLPPQNWFSLLIDPKNGVYPQQAGVASWLATFNDAVLAKIDEVEPELLLMAPEMIRSIGYGKLCCELLERVKYLSYQQRSSSKVRDNLHRLKNPETLMVLKEFFARPDASPASVELAIEIIEECNYDELAGIMAERTVNQVLPLVQRKDAAYAVSRLNDPVAKKRLKSLLPIDPASDPQDDMRGLVLRSCWPHALTSHELFENLTDPQRSNIYGAYRGFLEENLPLSLSSTLDASNSVDALSWAVQHITEDDPFDSIGRLARIIFTLCWKWATKPAFASLLADGYLNAVKAAMTPFYQDKRIYESPDKFKLSVDEFQKGVDIRFAVLTAIITEIDDSTSYLDNLFFNDYPLYGEADFDRLAEHIVKYQSGLHAEKWAACAKMALSLRNLDKQASKVDELHLLRPDLFDSAQVLRERWRESARLFEEREIERQQRREEGKEKSGGNQERLERDIKEAINDPNVTTEAFPWIAYRLNAENGMCSMGAIDIRESKGWNRLQPDEQNKLVALAEHYLISATIIPTEPNRLQYTVAQAMTALRLLKPNAYEALTAEVWRKCSVELLKAAIFEDKKNTGALLDRLSEKHPDIAQEALLNVIKQDLVSGSIFILHHWGNRLNDAQAEAVLDLARDPATEPKTRDLIAEELIRRGKGNVVSSYLNAVFSTSWGLPPDQGYHSLRRMAFMLSPNKYIGQIIELLFRDPTWGKQWLESVIGDYDRDMHTAVLQGGPQEIAKIYEWLYVQYPDSTKPQHDGGYTPGPLDEIHDLKGHLITYLAQSGAVGTADGLQALADKHPEDHWLHDCHLRAKKAELASGVPMLSIEQISDLRNEQSATRCLVNSIDDLLGLVCRFLGDYQVYLQGDTPAVVDLWNNSAGIAPKGEERFSDHFKRYLELKIGSHVVVNREVEIRKRLFDEGASGSRTDLWVQAFDEHGQALTLCIEVKCNWNDSAKTAIQDQLVAKYMSGGRATAGILLLGWFECSGWDVTDNRMSKAIQVWPDRSSAQANLSAQAVVATSSGKLVKSFVADCGLR